MKSELNIYQQSYKLAIDLHVYIEKDDKLNNEERTHFKKLVRDVIGNIAESFSKKPSKAKRYYNFKALDCIQQIMLDLDFLHDVQKIDTKCHKKFRNGYEEIAKELYEANKKILIIN